MPRPRPPPASCPHPSRHFHRHHHRHHHHHHHLLLLNLILTCATASSLHSFTPSSSASGYLATSSASASPSSTSSSTSSSTYIPPSASPLPPEFDLDLDLDLDLDSEAAPSNAGPSSDPRLGNADIAVLPSTLPGAGRGAFARRGFSAGDEVGTYRCTVVESGSEGQSALHTWKVNETHGCDGSKHTVRNPLLYVNSIAALGTCGRQNVEMALGENPGEADGAPPTVLYIATRDIKPGAELITDYGHGYWSSLAASAASYECGLSPLQLASSRGDLARVQAILRNAAARTIRYARAEGYDRAQVDAWMRTILDLATPWTALMEATWGGHASIVRVLLRAGADPGVAANDGTTALFLASSHEGNRHDRSIVNLLLEARRAAVARNRAGRRAQRFRESREAWERSQNPASLPAWTDT